MDQRIKQNMTDPISTTTIVSSVRSDNEEEEETQYIDKRVTAVSPGTIRKKEGDYQ
jgi:hypothetical protein